MRVTIMKNQIALPVNIQDIIDQKEKTLSMLEQSFKIKALAISEIERHTNTSFFYKFATPDIKTARNDLNRSLWHTLLSKTGLEQHMDQEALKQFEKGLEKNPPEFNMETIRATLIQAASEKDNMFNRGIVNLFKCMSNQYRTNDAFKVGNKFIIGRWFTACKMFGLSMNYHNEEQINDFDRVVCLLNGREFVPRTLTGALRNLLKNTDQATYEDDYIKIKMFKNGNAHVWLKKQKNVDQINEAIEAHYNSNALGGV